MISEANPLMDRQLEINPLLFLAVKLSLSLGLYVFVFTKNIPQSLLVKGATVLGAAVYSIVFGLHCYWIGCVLF